VAGNLNRELAVQILRLVVASSLDTVAAQAAGKVQVELLSGETPVGGTATLTCAAGQIRLEVPAGTGSATARVPPGEWTLTVEAFGYLAPEARAFPVVVDELHRESFQLVPLPMGTLAGRVQDPQGVGIPALVEVVGVPAAPVQASGDGAFALELPVGTYRLLASSLGFRSGLAEGVVVPSDEVSITLQPVPPTLLVDDDGDQQYETWFEAALQALDEPYLKVPAGELAGAADLAPFRTVVWLCGDRYDGVLPQGLRGALRAYVEAGGRLVVSGQDIGYGLKETAFYREVLGARFVADTAPSKRVTGAGLDFQLGGDGAGNQEYPDVIAPEAGATLWLRYREADGGGPGAATWTALGQGRSVYLAFGLEGADSAASRRELLGTCLRASDAAGARRRMLALGFPLR
jgi:hypothetical protein